MQKEASILQPPLKINRSCGGLTCADGTAYDVAMAWESLGRGVRSRYGRADQHVTAAAVFATDIDSRDQSPQLIDDIKMIKGGRSGVYVGISL